MTYAADLHIHSSYARATSRELNFENLSHWAKIKGIDLLATGDFTHPTWFAETGKKLKDTGDGLFELDGVKFVLGTELNCNAPQGGAVGGFICWLSLPVLRLWRASIKR